MSASGIATIKLGTPECFDNPPRPQPAGRAALIESIRKERFKFMKFEFDIVMEVTAVALPPLLTQKSAEGWDLVKLMKTGRVRTETWDVLLRRPVEHDSK